MLFFITSVGVQISTCKFLRQLKKYDPSEYEERKRNINILTWVCSTIIFIKGFSILMSFFHYNFYDIEEELGHEGMHLFFDIVQIVIFFLESVPSMIMLVVRWKIMNQYYKLNKASLIEDDRSSINSRSEDSNVSNYRLSYITKRFNHLNSSDQVKSSKSRLTHSANKQLLDGFHVHYDDRVDTDED